LGVTTFTAAVTGMLLAVLECADAMVIVQWTFRSFTVG
jgi:hypothetical protein